MPKHYDDWERLVAAVLRREHDRQLALSHSRDQSSNSSSCSCRRSSRSSSPLDHDRPFDVPERVDPLPMECSSLTRLDLKMLQLQPSNQNPLSEEDRWLREEQRWQREEGRWLREEARWKAERHAFLEEIKRLKLRVQELEWLNSETNTNIPKLLQGDLEEEEISVKEVISVPEKKQMIKKRESLKKVLEGDEEWATQENEGSISNVEIFEKQVKNVQIESAHQEIPTAISLRGVRRLMGRSPFNFGNPSNSRS